MSKPNAKLSNLTDGFRSAMLVTHDQDGSLRARPMALAEVEDPKVLWFATLQTSGKVDELRDDSRVAVTLQGSKRQVSLTGRAEVVIDADKIDAMWKDSWQVWFPEGRDSAIALVKVSVERGEEWDATLEDAAEFLYEAGRQLLTGENRDAGSPGEHRTVSF